MLIGVPAETTVGETRVAVTPETAKKLKAQGHTCASSRAPVCRQRHRRGLCGRGCRDHRRGRRLWLRAGAQGAQPFDNEVALMKPGTTVVGMLNPFDAAGLQRLAAPS
jgi:NAD(P) transhydrogenase subunit alpha